MQEYHLEHLLMYYVGVGQHTDLGGLMTLVGPITTTIVPMVYDGDSGGFGGPLDMNGPVVGSVGYKQTNADNLDISITLEFGQPNTKYEAFLTCGPAHALACGFLGIAVLTTDAVGAG